jgi:Flp pilus assembly protein TadD
MKTSLASLQAPFAPPAAVDEETRRAFAALGYAGTGATTITGPLPDPKAMIPTLALLHEGVALFAQQHPERAAAALRGAVDANPNMVDGWEYLGRSYQQLRQHEKALAAFERAMSLSGGLPEVALGTALSLVEVGRPEEALVLLRGQIERGPEDLRLAYLEVRILGVQGRLEEAARRASDTAARAPREADAVYQLGTVRMARHDLEGAERDFREALSLAPDHVAALSDLSVLLAVEGRRDESRGLLERLVALRPGDAVVASRLAELRR